MTGTPNIERLCIFCKQFYFTPGEPDWSETTPGYGAEMGCSLSIMEIDMENDTTASYRAKILTAKTCPHYELSEDMKL